MPSRNLKELMVFNYETTNRTDLRNGDIKPVTRTVYKEKPMCLRIRPPPLKHIHSLTDWKTDKVSFAVLFKPKDIVQTDPNNIQPHYAKPRDLGLEQAIKTRPRLVMTPAVSMDDISQPEVRNLLINDVYLTSAKKMMREGIESEDKGDVRAPIPVTPAPANPITLRKLEFPYVSPEWRMDSVTWDSRQLRACCDPSKEFFLARTPNCEACNVTTMIEAQRRMTKKMKKL